jgi:putative glycosyltransferase (TIGR04348 family)
MGKPSVVIVSPALADANNGNWQTASRWRRMLAPVCHARIVRRWPDADAGHDAMLIALHAKRSAQSIAAWARDRGARGLAVVLTGTDLYRDLATDGSVMRSLESAHLLVVLNDRSVADVPASVRSKVRVVLQSTTGRRELEKTRAHLRAVMAGHLREEKSPQTLFEAARLLEDERDIDIDHLGAALDPRLGKQAQATQAECPNFRWLGGVTHEEVRRRIQRAHVLVHASRIEGGAHVVMEAVCSGTPVLASRIAGNVGMLGAAYGGYFEHGNARQLADLLRRCRDGLGRRDDLWHELRRQCRALRARFDPAREKARLHRLIAELERGPQFQMARELH